MPKKLTTEEIDKRMLELGKGEYLVLGEYKGANTKILIKHKVCQNEYKATWNSFQTGNRCPKCRALKLKELYIFDNKEIDKKMFELVKDEYVRIGNYVNNSTKILIKHNLCGNIYEVTWNNFQKGNRCPKCFGNEKLNNKEIDKRMFELVKNEYIRLGNYINTHTKMLIKHNTCGNQYEVTWSHFKRGIRCPKCNESKGEKEISNILNSLNIKYTSQKRFKECRHKRSLPFDFYIKNKKSKLLIEFDGKQHFKPVKVFGGEENFRDTQLRDNIKNNFAKEKNIPLLRIPYTEQDNIKHILTNKLKELDFI